jgi:L-rhamnose mutarotase
MEHVLFIQKVKHEKREEYIGDHREAWPSLLKAIKESGIEREMIWINGNDTYLYIMAENFDKAMAELAEKRVFQDWLKKMGPLLAVMQDYSEEGKVVKLEKVFDLEKQLGESEKYRE